LKKTLIGKTLVIGFIVILLGASTFAIAMPNYKKQLYDEESVKITIVDTTSKKNIINQRAISADQAQKLIEAFLETEMTYESFYQQLQEKLNILQDNQLITQKTATKLSRTFKAHQLLLQKRNNPSRPAALFDVANIVNIAVFGIKGQKVSSLVELNTLQFPFLNGTISGQFTLASKFSGNGSVFSLGLLGWRYSYGHNQIKYPEFPHFPKITGGVIAFTGIIIEVESAQPGYPGHYVIGVGMSFITIWNRAE